MFQLPLKNTLFCTNYFTTFIFFAISIFIRAKFGLKD